MSAFNDLKDMAPLQVWPGLIGRALTGAEATLAQIELDVQDARRDDSGIDGAREHEASRQQ